MVAGEGGRDFDYILDIEPSNDLLMDIGRGNRELNDDKDYRLPRINSFREVTK